MAWSFQAKLSKLFLMHSMRLFIQPHYCMRQNINRNCAPRYTSHSWQWFGCTFDVDFLVSCITSSAFVAATEWQKKNTLSNQTDFRFNIHAHAPWIDCRVIVIVRSTVSLGDIIRSIMLLSKSVDHSPFSFMNSYKNNWSAVYLSDL